MAGRADDRDFLEAWGHAWSGGDADAVLPFYATDAVYTDVASGVTFKGHDEIRRFYRWLMAFSADSSTVFDAAYGDGVGLCARWTWSGTAAGPLSVHGHLYPATGRPFSVTGVAFCTLAPDGRVATHEDYWDLHTLLRQLGL